MEFNAPGELGWQALKYAARRLPETEQASFEEQLLADQTAREAVAQAVELSHTVAVLHSQESECVGAEGDTKGIVSEVHPVSFSSARTWPKSLVWMGVGIAASLAVVFAQPQWFAGNGRADAAPSNELVAASWVDLQSGDSESGNSVLTSFPVDPYADVDDATTPNPAISADVVPEWLRLGIGKEPAAQK